MLTAILSFVLATPAFAQESVSTFRDKPGYTMISDGAGVSYRGGEWYIPNWAMMMTLGKRDFHIRYRGSNKGGYLVISPNLDPQAAHPFGVRGWIFGKLDGDVSDHGISCDLKSPTSVLHFDKAETRANVAFKILEFKIGSAFDGKPVRYLRLVVSENGDVMPLDLDLMPMAAILPGEQSKAFDPHSYLKKHFIDLKEGSSGEKIIRARKDHSLTVVIRNKEFQLYRGSQRISLTEAYSSFQNLAHLNPDDVLVSTNEMKKHIQTKQNNLPKGAAGIPILRYDPVPLSLGELNLFTPFKSLKNYEHAVGDAEMMPYLTAMKQSYYSSILNFDDAVVPVDSFELTGKNRQDFLEFMAFFTQGFYEDIPAAEAYLLDMKDTGEQNAELFFEDYLKLIARKKKAVIVVLQENRAVIRYLLPGMKAPLKSLLTVDPDQACNLALRELGTSKN